MQRNRPVPGIARGPQQFSPSNLPPIPSPMPLLRANQPPQVPPPEVAFQDQLQDLAMEIYCRLVSKHIATTTEDEDPERRSRLLRDLAKAAQAAARAYFESMGVTFPS